MFHFCTGPFDTALKWLYRAQLQMPTYQEVALSRKLWLERRHAIEKLPLDNVHFVAVATSESAELSNLRMSARLAGITIEVSDFFCVYCFFDDDYYVV